MILAGSRLPRKGQNIGSDIQQLRMTYVITKKKSLWSKKDRHHDDRHFVCTGTCRSAELSTAAVAQWIRRLPTEQEIHGSSPCSGMILIFCQENIF